MANWNAIRSRLIMAGITNPLRDLPDMYALIDVTEQMLLESFKEERDRERYWITTYKPIKGQSMAKDELPPGWSAEDEMADFDALLD